MFPHQRVLTLGPGRPVLQLFRRRIRIAAALDRLERVQYPQVRETLLLVVGQYLIRRVGAAELCLTAVAGEDVGGQGHCFRRRFVHRPVEMPVIVAREVADIRVGRIEADLHDIRVRVLRELNQLPELATELDLDLIVDGLTTQQQDTVFFER